MDMAKVAPIKIKNTPLSFESHEGAPDGYLPFLNHYNDIFGP